MTRGNHLSKELRQAIHYNCVIRKVPAGEAHQMLFQGDNGIYTLARLKILISSLHKMSEAEIITFLQGPTSRRVAGRPRKFGTTICNELVSLRREKQSLSINALLQEFHHFYQTEGEEAPSPATMCRILQKERVTRKVMVRRNVHADAEAQCSYLNFIAALDPDDLVDIDETLSSAKEFEAKYGWAPEGQEATQFQIRIGSHAYSTIAAYTTTGFIAWAIYEGSVTALEVRHFLNHSLAPALTNTSVGVLDNATVHKTDGCRETLEAVFHGTCTFCPPYSPELKPIEKGFSLVKRYLREHEVSAMQDPVWWINHAFQLYSRDGERCSSGNAIMRIMFLYALRAFTWCFFCTQHLEIGRVTTPTGSGSWRS